jgi:hypothetical protein
MFHVISIIYYATAATKNSAAGGSVGNVKNFKGSDNSGKNMLKNGGN